MSRGEHSSKRNSCHGRGRKEKQARLKKSLLIFLFKDKDFIVK